jgi:hypothetical protein
MKLIEESGSYVRSFSTFVTPRMAVCYISAGCEVLLYGDLIHKSFTVGHIISRFSFLIWGNLLQYDYKEQCILKWQNHNKLISLYLGGHEHYFLNQKGNFAYATIHSLLFVHSCPQNSKVSKQLDSVGTSLFMFGLNVFRSTLIFVG